jgi:endonuclease/exonuclease/phosphatase (EEP) superfamily protein YafD
VEGFHYYASANLARGKTHYGVLTASSAKSGESIAGLSEGRELYFTTRKPYLLNTLPLPNGQTLLCLNLHAINFRENAQYTRELRELTTHLASHRGPMILSGDFNSWNPVRQKRLETLRRQLSLESVPFEREKLKSFGKYPLDFIFYRALTLKRFDVLELSEYSDHNPLLAEFEFESGEC